MKETRKIILNFIYEHEQTSSDPCYINKEVIELGIDLKEQDDDIRYLIDREYIREKIMPMGAGYYNLALTEKGEQLVENKFHSNNNDSKPNIVINAQGANNSIIGTQHKATINNGISIEDLNKLIESHNTPDKELLDELLILIQKIVEENQPVKKGIFSKFAETLQRNEWITAPIMTFLLEKFFM